MAGIQDVIGVVGRRDCWMETFNERTLSVEESWLYNYGALGLSQLRTSEGTVSDMRICRCDAIDNNQFVGVRQKEAERAV